MDKTKSTRLGQILLEKGLVSKEQLDIAVQLQAQRRKDTNLDEQVPTSLGEILIEQGFISRLELNRGLNWQMLLRKMTLVMSLCAPMMAVFTPVATAASSSSSSSSSSSASLTLPKRIEAENYSTMSGVQAEPTTDIGGGKNLGYMDNNDWMAYKNVTINAPVAGSYKITYRLASSGGGGSFTLKNADTNVIYDTVDVADTGGQQKWKNVERIINLPAGNHSFLISVVNRGKGFNLNWFEVESVGSQLPVTIQAENYSTMSGVQPQPTTDVGGGQNLGYIDANDWMSYANQRIYIPITGTYKITYRIASPSGGGSFSLKEADGSATYDTVSVSSTGGFQTWKDVERTVTLTQGTHSFMLSVIGRGSGFNLNWFKVENVTSTSSKSASSVSSTSNVGVSSSSSSKASVTSSSKTSSSVPSTTNNNSSNVSMSSSSSSKASVTTSSKASSSAPSTTNNNTSNAGKVSAVAGSVGVTWLIPNQRENGDILDVTELGGYELRYRKDTDTAFTYVTINDAWQNFYNFSWLSGNYIFQISAFDKNGMYSGFVDLIPR